MIFKRFVSLGRGVESLSLCWQVLLKFLWWNDGSPMDFSISLLRLWTIRQCSNETIRNKLICVSWRHVAWTPYHSKLPKIVSVQVTALPEFRIKSSSYLRTFVDLSNALKKFCLVSSFTDEEPARLHW